MFFLTVLSPSIFSHLHAGDPPEEFDLWSPAAAAAAAAAAASASASAAAAATAAPVPGVSPSISPPNMAYSGFATAAADEVTRLHQLVEDLELANGTLNEKLIESHLETKALRRASDEWRVGQLVLDQKAMVVDDKTSEAQERQSVGAAAPEGSGLDKKPWVDGMSSAFGWLGQGDQQRDRPGESLRTDETSKEGGQEEELSLRGPGQGLTAHCSSSVGGDRLEAGRASAGASADARGGETSQSARDPGCEPDQETSTRPSQENIYASAVSPSSPSKVLRRLPSITEGPDEQAELIDALRGQVDQLRLEAQRAGSVTSLPGARRGTRSAELQDCRRRGSSRHSSDEDSSSDNSSNDDSGNANANGSGGLETCPPPTSSLNTAGEERSSPVGDTNISIDDGQTIRMLQARVRDLSAELMTANLELLRLREQARTDQDEMTRLQRENLSSHRLGLNSAMVAAAAARASATAASSGARPDCQRCGYSPRADEDSSCLNHDGLRWIHGLWLRLANGLGGEQRRNGETERFRGERWRYGSAGYEWGRGEGNRLRFDVDERASLLQQEEEEVKHTY